MSCRLALKVLLGLAAAAAAAAGLSALLLGDYGRAGPPPPPPPPRAPRPAPGGEATNLFWGLQVSDLHVSRFLDRRRVSDFERFCSETIDAVRPELVLVTGNRRPAPVGSPGPLSGSFREGGRRGGRRNPGPWISLFSHVPEREDGEGCLLSVARRQEPGLRSRGGGGGGAGSTPARQPCVRGRVASLPWASVTSSGKRGLTVSLPRDDPLTPYLPRRLGRGSAPSGRLTNTDDIDIATGRAPFSELCRGWQLVWTRSLSRRGAHGLHPRVTGEVPEAQKGKVTVLLCDLGGEGVTFYFILFFYNPPPPPHGKRRRSAALIRRIPFRGKGDVSLAAVLRARIQFRVSGGGDVVRKVGGLFLPPNPPDPRALRCVLRMRRSRLRRGRATLPPARPGGSGVLASDPGASSDYPRLRRLGGETGGSVARLPRDPGWVALLPRASGTSSGKRGPEKRRGSVGGARGSARPAGGGRFPSLGLGSLVWKAGIKTASLMTSSLPQRLARCPAQSQHSTDTVIGTISVVIGGCLATAPPPPPPVQPGKARKVPASGSPPLELRLVAGSRS
uniref:Calcineurin-like phosphoesterase domain-containing protein n=1 Tax=Ornithorhynchus anatinus TaxID=9258 RepID=A0A6I8PAF4_ORNAN